MEEEEITMARLPWGIALVASLVTASAYGNGPIVIKSVKGSHALLVGEPDMTRESLSRAVGAYGVVKGTTPDGFFRVVLKKDANIARAKKAIKAAGIEYVFDENVGLDKSSLPSVQRHIAYLKARNDILNHEESEMAQEGERVGGVEHENGLDFYEALEYYLKARVGPNGKIDRDEIVRAGQQRDSLPDAPIRQNGNGPGGLWAFVGPTDLNIPYTTYYGTPPLSGRKMGLAVSPSSPSTMYVASAGGGIWKTTDAGVNWSPLSDKWSFLYTSSVAVHPTNANIVLAGTGDYDGFFQRQTQGIMRSTDGGTTWTQVGTADMKQACITEIMFDPVNPNIVICITGKNNDATPGSTPGGIYRSTDGGLTWTARLVGAYWDDMDRATDGTYYACGVSPNFDNIGYIYKSTDSGNTWNTVTFNPNGNNQKALALACSTNNAGTFYLLSTGDEAIYKTTDGGATGGNWTNIKGNFPNGYTGNTNYNWSQKDYDNWIGVMDQGASDVVLVGLIGVNQDAGGDGTWTDISKTYAQSPPNYVHSDEHMFARHPTNANVAFFGCDGGLFRYTYAANPTAGNFESLNKNIRDIQFYHIAVHPTDSNYVQGGAQDNSSPASLGNLASWSNLYAGDGGWGGYDKNSPGVHYTSSQFCSVFRFPTANATNGSATDISPGINSNFIAPVVVAGNGSQVYAGGNRIYRWSSGHTWNALGPNPIGTSSTDYCNTIGVHPTNGNVMYTGTNAGVVYRTLDGWSTWKRIDDANIDRPVGAIAVAPSNQGDVLVGLQGSGSKHLWRCANTGAATPVFTDASGTAPYLLPDSPINGIARDPYEVSRWYVATDVGVFMTSNNGVSWYNMQALGLPNVHVNDLQINAAKTYLYAGTYGRGMWRIPITASPSSYTISGNVKTVGNANFPGVDVYLRRKSTWALPTLTANPGVPIPDNDTTGVSSTLSETATNVVSGGSISVNITHAYRGDIQIMLTSPDGQTAILKQTSNDSGDDIVATYDFGLAFHGIKANGNWKLTVKDLFSGDTGTLNQWKLNLKYFDYATVAKRTTDGSGNYSFTNQVAGQYLVFPLMTGKTWTPAQRFPNLGPGNATAQDFKANQ